VLLFGGEANLLPVVNLGGGDRYSLQISHLFEKDSKTQK
jgi:hypothetical protein